METNNIWHPEFKRIVASPLVAHLCERTARGTVLHERLLLRRFQHESARELLMEPLLE
jgi:hypothetical protein